MVRVCCCFELAVQAEAEQLRRENARCVPCGTRSTAHGPYMPTRHATQHATYSATQHATTESLRPAAVPRCAGSWLRRLWRRKRTRWASDQAALRCRPPRETSSLVRPMRSHCARVAAFAVTTAPGARSRQRAPRLLPLGQPRTLRATGHFRARARARRTHTRTAADSARAVIAELRARTQRQDRLLDERARERQALISSRLIPSLAACYGLIRPMPLIGLLAIRKKAKCPRGRGRSNLRSKKPNHPAIRGVAF